MAYVGWNNMPAGMSGALKGYIARKKYGSANMAHASALGRGHKGAGASFLHGLSNKMPMHSAMHSDSETSEPAGKEEKE